MNPVLIVLGISFLIDSILASIIGLACMLLGSSFIIGFLFGFAIFSFIGMLWNTFTSKMISLKLIQSQAELKTAELYQNTRIVCAYCGLENHVKLVINGDNTFICKSCNNTNGVVIHITTTQKTTPLIADQVVDNVFNKIDTIEQSRVNTENINIK